MTLLLDIDDEFKTQLRDLTPSALSSENLVVKSINGGEVTCRGLLEYFKVIVLFLSCKARKGLYKKELRSFLCQTRENMQLLVSKGKRNPLRSVQKKQPLPVVGKHACCAKCLKTSTSCQAQGKHAACPCIFAENM